jgi:hypothetical protein
MPIDLYKLMGYDYRDKKRETQLSVDADVERARRIAADDFEAKKSQALELEGIAGKRFKENYAKTRLADGQTEGIGEEAETAWAKKVASGDLKGTLDFEETAGKLPGTRKLAGTTVEAAQEEAEARAAAGKEKKMRGLAAVAAILGGGDTLSQIANSNLGAEAAGAKAGETEAETKRDVSAVLKPDAAKVAQEQREAAGRMTQLGLAGQELGLDAQYLRNREQYLNNNYQPAMNDARLRGLRGANVGQDISNEAGLISLDIAPEMNQAIIKAREAQAEADRARAKGNKPGLGLSGESIAPVRRGPLTADELDFGNSLR